MKGALLWAVVISAVLIVHVNAKRRKHRDHDHDHHDYEDEKKKDDSSSESFESQEDDYKKRKDDHHQKSDEYYKKDERYKYDRDQKNEHNKQQKKDSKEIVGDYVLTTELSNHTNFDKFMRIMEFRDKDRKEIKSQKKIQLTIRSNKTFWSIKVSMEPSNKSFEYTFESGEEFRARLPNRQKRNMTVTVNEKKHRMDGVIKMDGFEARAKAKFDEKGINLTLSALDVKAKLKFERVNKYEQAYRNFAEGFKKFADSMRHLWSGTKKPSKDDDSKKNKRKKSRKDDDDDEYDDDEDSKDRKRKSKMDEDYSEEDFKMKERKRKSKKDEYDD